MDNLTSVLKSHKDLLKVELESKDTKIDVHTWNNIAHSVFMAIVNPESLPLDTHVSNAMVEFGKIDDLMIVNKAGRLLRRFAKYFKESAGYKLPDNVQGIIGDKIQYMLNREAKTYYIDFTDSINWQDGQFGKRGSCWFGTYSESVPSFENAGGWGIRFYNDENQNDDNGCGRTWILPKDGMLMCFNSYGVERPSVSKVIKAVYAKHGITLHYKAVELYNSQNDCIPYINSGTGFILFPESIDESTLDDRYDVDIEAEEDDRMTCVVCGDRIDDDEVQIINDDCYCQYCRDDRFSFCDKCNEYCDKDDVHQYQDQRYDYICRYCAESLNAGLCENCDEYTDDYIITEDTGECYCPNCDDHYYYCESCNEYNTEEHDHSDEDESNEEESDNESDGGDSLSDSDITAKIESVTYKNYDRELRHITQLIYRHVRIDGLYIWQYKNEYNITHETSGQAVKFGIPSLELAITFLKRLEGLCNWTITGDEIVNDRELCNRVLQIRQEMGI